MSLTSDLATDLAAIVGDRNVYTEPKALKVFSADAYYYSPVLVEQLGEIRADVVVAPGSQDELLKLMRYAVHHNVPINIRGAGTGNYGQAVPLEGGIQVLTRRLNKILSVDSESQSARVEPGVLLGALERQGREVGLELPCYPSTYATATVGGFVGGGFGGVGSIRNGTLWDGMVRGATVLSAEDEPRFVDVSGDEVLSIIHAYGVTGIISELRIGLVPAESWEECALSFPDLASMLRFGHALSQHDTFDKRLICLAEWPIPSFFKPLVQEEGVSEGRGTALLEVGEGQTDDVTAFAEQYGGALDWRRSSSAYHKSRFSLSDFSWNHTTLWAMKADETYTYLQATFSADPERALEQIGTLKARYGDDLLMHLEYINRGRGENAELNLGSLPVVYYRGKAHLYDMIDAFEAEGVQVANPHTWILDEDPRWNGQPVVEARLSRNPQGLLNPGRISDEALQPTTETA